MPRVLKTKKPPNIFPPKLIYVGGWEITCEAEEDLDNLGEYDHNDFSITYSSEQSPTNLADTIWHELFHTLEGFTQDELGEKVVARWASASLAIMRNNPRLVEFLMQGTDYAKGNKRKQPVHKGTTPKPIRSTRKPRRSGKRT